MRFVVVYALESCVYCSSVDSFGFIVQDIVSLFSDSLEHYPYFLDEFHLEYSSR